MFAAGAAAKIAAGQQDAGPGIFRPIQYELQIVRSVVQISPIEEQELAEAGSFNPFEKLLWNDLIGIDVRSIHRNDESGMCGEWTHGGKDWRLGIKDYL